MLPTSRVVAITARTVRRGTSRNRYGATSRGAWCVVRGRTTARGLAPNRGPECATLPTTLVLPGDSINTGALDTGTYRFQCLIHPWQRTTVTVR